MNIIIAGAKPVAKKTSDAAKGAPNARKTSTAVKKSEPAKVLYNIED